VEGLIRELERHFGRMALEARTRLDIVLNTETPRPDRHHQALMPMATPPTVTN
jgi:hypothetical protein